MQSNKQWQTELEQLAQILNKAPLEKSIKWGGEVFTHRGKNVVSFGGFKNHFTLWFFNGVFLKDKYKVLVNAQEGKTKSLRQWRFTTAAEINEKTNLEYIKEAIEIEKKGLKIKPEKLKPIPQPELLAKVLQKDKKLRLAFEQLSPGKQKEYILYINEARQDATKITRIEKIKPLILQGSGLHDQYK